MKPNCAQCGEKGIKTGFELRTVSSIQVGQDGLVDITIGTKHEWLFCSAKCLANWIHRGANYPNLERAERAAKRKRRK